MSVDERRRTLPDVQSRGDVRGIMLDDVGIEGIRYPVRVLSPDGDVQQTVAVVAMSVSLAPEVKGTHMSRFIELLHEHCGNIERASIPRLLQAMRSKLEAERARVSIAFPHFMQRSAPASGAEAYVDYEIVMRGEMDASGARLELQVSVPVTSLCPCSKEISDYGAHNQRGIVTIEVSTDAHPPEEAAQVWIDELVSIAERAASAPVYALLKRPDERHVTMQAYENPVFVEDIARNVAHELRRDDRISAFRVKALNHESIHNHDAFAAVTWKRLKD